MRIWSHLLKKSLMKNFIFCAVFHPLDRLQRTVYKEFLLLRWSPHFSVFEPPRNSTCNSNSPHAPNRPLPSLLEATSGDTGTQTLVISSVSTLFTRSQISRSKICWLPQVRYLIACSNFKTSIYKFMKFHLKSACNCKFHVLTI